MTEIELGLLWPQTLGGSTATNFWSNFLEHTHTHVSCVVWSPECHGFNRNIRNLNGIKTTFLFNLDIAKVPFATNI